MIRYNHDIGSNWFGNNSGKKSNNNSVFLLGVDLRIKYWYIPYSGSMDISKEDARICLFLSMDNRSCG